MSSSLQIVLVAVAAGTACALAGVFLVLRRLAMVSDAISHSVLPGLIAGYVLAKGPNLLAGFVGATLAGLVTVWAIDALARTRRVRQDTSIGLVFPAMFALGVLIISKFFGNLHIDTDAVLFGEIAFAPFDTLQIGGRDLGPTSLWLLGGLAVLNALFLALLYKELKLSTFDATLAAALGFAPSVVHGLLMAVVAMTTVGAFSAVGAVLAVALIIVPAVCGTLLSDRLPGVLTWSLIIGTASGTAGCVLALAWDVSISGMIATTLGVAFLVCLILAPRRGLVAAAFKRRRHRRQFAVEMLAVHLLNHESAADADTECTLMHLEQELGWDPRRALRTARMAAADGLAELRDGRMRLTAAGRAAAQGRLSIQP